MVRSRRDGLALDLSVDLANARPFAPTLLGVSLQYTNFDLSGCTLYTNVEPCAMCSFPIRETRISRVVYAIGSRLMGGDSKWDILADPELSKVMPEAFGEAPEVVRGFMRRDAERAWRNWNPLIWGVIRYRGCFGEPPKAEPVTKAPPRRRSLFQKLFALHS